VIVVVGRVRTTPEKAEDLIHIGQAVAEASRDEGGCLDYRFYADTEDPEAYLFVEEWESMEALQRHFTTPHVATMMQEIPDAIAGTPEVQFHEVARSIGLADIASA
jgi:quinol monooxygenase YgiN